MQKPTNGNLMDNVMGLLALAFGLGCFGVWFYILASLFQSGHGFWAMQWLLWGGGVCGYALMTLLSLVVKGVEKVKKSVNRAS